MVSDKQVQIDLENIRWMKTDVLAHKLGVHHRSAKELQDIIKRSGIIRVLGEP